MKKKAVPKSKDEISQVKEKFFPTAIFFEEFNYSRNEVLFNTTKNHWYSWYRCPCYRATKEQKSIDPDFKGCPACLYVKLDPLSLQVSCAANGKDHQGRCNVHHESNYIITLSYHPDIKSPIILLN